MSERNSQMLVTQYTPSHAYNTHESPCTEFENKAPPPSTPSPHSCLTCVRLHLPPPSPPLLTSHSFSMSEAIPMDDSPGPCLTKKRHKVRNHRTDSGHASSKFLISHLSSQFLTTQFQMQVACLSLGRHLHPGQKRHLCLYPKGAGATPAVQARPKDRSK